MKKPQIVRITQKQLEKRIGGFGRNNSNVHAITVGNRIYLTPKAKQIDKEHELAHVRLGHKNKGKMNAYTYDRREVIAEKTACNKLNRKVSKGYLDEVRKDIKEIWGKHTTDKSELSFRAKDAVNKASKRYGIKHRV
jgi:predicted DNA-binding WGR domain protein